MKKSLHILTISLLLVGMVALAQTSRQVQKMDNAKIGGTTSLEATAALEVQSTTLGVLIPRMNSTQRDAITDPANALLIFNTTNNGFEVYKTSCPCWVPISDGGNTPASNLVNTPPTATTLNYSGAFITGQTVTISYVYSDLQSDPEGATSIQWQRATSNAGAGLTNIPGATNTTYTLTAADVGLFIRAVVTPRATTGVLNGVLVTGNFTQAESGTTPFPSNIGLTGTPAQGSTLTGTYTYTGPTTESTSTSTPTLYIWQTATSADGANIATANLYGATAFGTTYVPQADLLGRFIRFGVRARDANGVQAVNFVYTPWVGPIATSSEAVPVATNVSYSPNPGFGLTLTGTYTYFDANGDPESGSEYQWFTATDANGTGQAPIVGATNTSYSPTAGNGGSFIGFGVTPKAGTGNTAFGTPAVYYAPVASVGPATFTFTGNSDYLPYFSINRLMDADNRLRIQIDVTATGAINVTSTTVNGYSFSGAFVINSTGLQWLTLTATGQLAVYNTSGDTFTITGTASSIETQNITILHTLRGMDFTTFSNGTENFSNNTTCSTKLISAGYNATTCNGTVAVGSNTYNLVLINGQCWMRENLKEIPTAGCTSPINTGCNVWTNTAANDTGMWGYHNTTTTTGASGWATTEPVANYGLLYQFSAAMNGSTTERAQGVCPAGFHIPSDCEFMYLEHGLGMLISDQNLTSYRNSGNTAGKLANFTRVNSAGANGSGTNSSGFTGLPSGDRLNSNGSFRFNLTASNLHTSTLQSATIAISRTLERANWGVGRGNTTPFATAQSVRCLKN